MYYTYDEKNSIRIPAPFGRAITPIFMKDDDKITETNFSIHMTEWEPGCAIDEHLHEDAMEAMYCIAGEGVARVNGEDHPFFPGSMIVAPPRVTHKISNTGGETLRVLCVFSPPTTGAGLRERALQAVKEAEEHKEESK